MKDVTEFREFLGETMRKVLSGEATVDQAKAISMVAAEINASTRNEIELARATDGDFKGTGFIDVTPRPQQRAAIQGVRS
ncbi:hypothetical protein WG219_11365 [Ectopseudomonas mendocina]|uniref:Uncharacterized protein n=1 Tax=Ectopseudomonas mendocina TaxID=300 RepID=A0ABZ2RAB4_ECTME